MTNIVKSLMLLAAAVLLILSTACKDNNPKSDGDELEVGNFIRLGLPQDLVTKTPGSITDIKQMTEQLAVYATTFKKIGADRVFTWPATPLISTTTATINTTSTDPKELGELVYYTGQPTPFPEEYTTVYAMFPTGGTTGVTAGYEAGTTPVAEPWTATMGGPNASIVLKDRYDSQYDILYANILDLKRESLMNKGKAEIVFNHALSQFKIRLYAETALSGQLKLSKVVVNALSEAQMIGTEGNMQSGSLAGSMDMVMYDNANSNPEIDIPITDDREMGVVIPTALMLFPHNEMGTVNSIELTVNGQKYLLNINNPGMGLEKGKINTITIKMTSLGLKFDLVAGNLITPWLVGGADNNGNTNVVNYKTALSLKLQNSPIINAASYTPTGNLTAEVEINGGYWLEHTNADHTKTKQIPCDFTAGALKFKEHEPTLMLNDDPVFLTHLRIFDNGVKIFDASALKGELLIPKTASGDLEYTSRPGVPVMTNVLFGGFGEGSVTYPYLVQNIDQLKNLAKFVSATPLAIDNLNFKQTQTLDLNNENWTPIGTETKKFYGSYDGAGFAIEKLASTSVTSVVSGLFGSVGPAANDGVAKFANITLKSGLIDSPDVSGALIGMLSGPAIFEKIHNSGVAVTSSAASAGGLVGEISATAKSVQFKDCTNSGEIKATPPDNSSGSTGGIYGKSTNEEISLINSHNTGKITATFNGGGLFGRMTSGQRVTVEQCSNKAAVVGTFVGNSAVRLGGLIGIMLLAEGTNPMLSISNSFNAGSVTGHGAQLGGLIGAITTNKTSSRNGTIKACYNTGVVTITDIIVPTASNNGVGGLVGFTSIATDNPTFNIQNCYIAAEVITQSNSVLAAYLIGRTATAKPTLDAVTATYFQTGLPTTDGRDIYGPSGVGGTLPSTDLKTQAGVDLINNGENLYVINLAGFPKLTWEK